MSEHKRNIYLCPQCGHGFVSIDLHQGVTPFATPCLRRPICRGIATSMFYMAPQQFLERVQPAIEWHRPTEVEMFNMDLGVRQHVEKGGLISRPATKSYVLGHNESKAGKS